MSRTRTFFAVVSLALAVGATAASPSSAQMPYKAASHCQALQNEQVERGIVDENGEARSGCDNGFGQ